MSVPDEVIFGPDNAGGKLTYGHVRGMTDDHQRLVSLKARLDDWLISQTAEMVKTDGNGKRLVYCPFPLAVLTCVATETAGQLFFGDSSNDDDRGTAFKKMLSKVDQRFSRPLRKPEKQAVRDRWSIDGLATPSDLLYTYFRNTLVHGYRGRAVYITEGLPEWVFEDGTLIVNPYWLWAAFTAAFERMFEDVLKKSQSGERSTSLRYLDALLA